MQKHFGGELSITGKGIQDSGERVAEGLCL